MPRSYDKATNKRIEIGPNGNGGGTPPSSPPPPPTYCPMDISILVDLSGSTKGPGSGPSTAYPNLPQLDGLNNWHGHPGLAFESQRNFVDSICGHFKSSFLVCCSHTLKIFFALLRPCIHPVWYASSM